MFAVYFQNLNGSEKRSSLLRLHINIIEISIKERDHIINFFNIIPSKIIRLKQTIAYFNQDKILYKLIYHTCIRIILTTEDIFLSGYLLHLSIEHAENFFFSSKRLFELSKRYLAGRLSHSVPLIVKLIIQLSLCTDN
ncbi:hypothetical protein BpHYR1_013780 [Brachionus plicatilis]|uniref:Uncharacterized protein n=1 Tax=Brachionus plicatilis TaxID=10195 RepID=A0A3M7RBG5_BRAPC|nr:hypothetical protein BpHYR1_013780 [Brachionus plicatilis]